MATSTLGVHHLGLTVGDVNRARDFFVDALGFVVVGGRPSYPAIFVSDGTTMLTLWQAQIQPANPFDRKGTVGLHHLALRVGSVADLESLHRRLAARNDVIVEFSPQALGSNGAMHMMCAGPSSVRIELTYSPA